MSQNSKIEWTDHTFNPWTGCTKVSPGCDGCYAEAWSKRAGPKVGKWGPGMPRVRTTPANWSLPLRWNAQADAFMAQHGRRQRVFCASLADVFDNEVPELWRWNLFRLIHATPNLDWLLLTKRIGNAADMLEEAAAAALCDFEGRHRWSAVPWSHVWIGATVVNQLEADRDIPKLLATPAARRFLSMEPLLGPVDLTAVRLTVSAGYFGDCLEWHHRPHSERYTRWPGIDWVIVGGESGPRARPMHPDWARRLRDQCQAAGVPFLFKQWGEWVHDLQQPDPTGDSLYTEDMSRLRFSHTAMGRDGRTSHDAEQVGSHSVRVHKVGKKAAGRLLDGRTWNEVPA